MSGIKGVQVVDDNHVYDVDARMLVLTNQDHDRGFEPPIPSRRTSTALNSDVRHFSLCRLALVFGGEQKYP